MILRRPAVVILAILWCVLVAATAQPERAKPPRLEDWIAEPGSTQKFQPFMLHADQWFGIDQRAKLDSIVFVLENGGRICQVMDRDSTWAVDYTWVYPHNLLPPRWYDARALFHAGDSLKLPEIWTLPPSNDASWNAGADCTTPSSTIATEF